MNREVPYDDNLKCDLCHKQGAYDFMGDFICADCMDIYKYLEQESRD